MIPPPLSNLISDRRCWLFLLTSALAGVIGFVAVPDDIALTFVSKAGFWFILGTFIVWLRALWLTFAADLKAMTWKSVDWVSVLIICAGGAVLLTHEEFGFKIIMDEIMLLGTSMSMHFDKSVLTPYRGSDIHGAFVILDGLVDKRPLFFPFLVSLLHDIFGYRPANAFVLNAILTFVFLGLIFAAGRILAGRLAGWLGVVLFAGLPLLAQNSTGGGFELLNLTMILATLLLGARWVEKRDDPSLTAFCYAALLLAQVRYESVIYLVPVALLVIVVWLQDRRATLPWPVLVAPLLMVPYPLHHRIFQLRESSWEMFSQPGYAKPFSLSYIPENLDHAFRFFFGAASDQPNSIVLSALGVLAVPFFVLLLAKQVRAFTKQSAASVAVIIFSIGFVLQFLLLMAYFWGKFDDVVIRRLSLPTHLGIVIALLAILPQFAKTVVLRSLIVVAIVGLLARSVPSMAAHAYTQEYLPGREVALRREFMAAQPHSDYLAIDNDSTLWITHLVCSSNIKRAKERREDIAFHLRNRTFSDVFVFQRFNIDPDTNEMTLREGDDLGPAFVLEPVMEKRMRLLTLSRISRVKEIRANDVSISIPEPIAPSTSKSRAEIEEGRRRFYEAFLQHLP